MKKLEVLIIGPGSSKSESGGVVSVIENLIENLDSKYKITRIITMRPVGIFNRLILYVNSFYLIFKSKLNKNNKIAHMHMASRFSFYRKSLIVLVLKVLQIPSILHLHGAEFHIFFSEESSLIKKKYIKWIFGLSNKVILLTHSWDEWYKNSICEKNSTVIYNGTGNYYHKASIPIEQRDNIVLFLGRLGKRKGIYDLLNAFKDVLSKIPNAQLKIGGDGEVDLCKKLAKELNISSNVSFLGWVGEEEKGKLLNEAKIYILPSYNEGLPMGVLEAMSAGIGIITTPVGGIPEAIENNKNGILVKEGSVEEIADAIISILSDSDKNTTLGLEAKKTYHEKFEIKKVAIQVERIYDGLYEGEKYDI